MAKYSDERIDIADLKILKDILSSDRKKLEIDIINVLGDIYTLSDKIVNNQDMLRKNYKFMFNTFGNFIKTSLFSSVSYIAIINYLDKDPSMLYSFFNCFLPTMVGYHLFQKDNVKENYISGEDLTKVYENDLFLSNQLQEYVEVYFETMRLYFGNNTSSIKDEMKKVFDNNKKYIENNIKNSRFLDDFSYDTVLEVASDFLDDENFKKYVSFYESKQKQRKR